MLNFVIYLALVGLGTILGILIGLQLAMKWFLKFLADTIGRDKTSELVMKFQQWHPF